MTALELMQKIRQQELEGNGDEDLTSWIQRMAIIAKIIERPNGDIRPNSSVKMWWEQQDREGANK